MSELNTDQLLARSREGDNSARQELLIRHRDRLRRMISAFLDPQLASRLDPSDVLQDALTCAAIRLPDYLNGQPLPFYPWLRQIVREQLIMAHRKHVLAERRTVRKEQQTFPGVSDASAMQLADQLVSQESSPSQRASTNELKQKVRNGLEELAESDRELLLMRFVEQLKVREISEIVLVSEPAVKSRLSRALLKLNQLVRDND